MKFLFFLISSFFISTGIMFGQDSIPSGQFPKQEKKFKAGNFFITGNGYYDFQLVPLLHAAVFPIVLWHPTQKLFFETEASLELEGEDIAFDIEYATIHYSLNKYLTIGAGKFLCPFGTYQEKLHPAWVNKFQETPLGFSHDDALVGPMSEIGIELRGGSPMGNSKINYAAYISNGPQLITNSDDSLMNGMLEYGKLKDNNRNKAVGGRIGFMPFSNSSLEVGASWQFGKVGDKNDSLFSKAKAAMHAFDLNYVKSFPVIKGTIDIKGQYNHVLIDKTNSSSSASMDNSNDMYNVRKAYYLQFAYRPSLLRVKVVRNIELAARYSALRMSEKGMAGINNNQFTIGLNYWMSWRTVLKFAYQLTQENGEKNSSAFLMQFAFGHPQFKFKTRNKTKEKK